MLGSTRIAGDDLVDGLRRAGVELAIGMDDPRGYFAALRRSDLRMVLVHDERSGGFLADGYTRASRRPACVSGNSGPGAANLLSGLVEAECSSTPIVAVVGEMRPVRFGTHAFQEADHRALLGGLMKAVVEPRNVADFAAAAHQAVQLSLVGRPGPTLLLVEDPLLWTEVKEGAGPTESPSVLSRTTASPEHFPRVFDLLAGAQRGILFAGNGALIADAGQPLLEFARRHHLPIAMSPLGKGAVSDLEAIGVASSYTSGSYGVGKAALDALKAADVIVVVGSDLDPISTAGAWPSPDQQVIRIDIDPAECLAVPAINLLGDAKATLEALLAAPGHAGPSDAQRAWAERTKRAADRHRDEILAADFGEHDRDGVWPGALVQRMAAPLGKGDAIVADGSYVSAWALDRVVQEHAGRFVFAPRGIGMLGWGFPASLGVKIARPTGTIVGFVGDGAMLFALADMKTAVRERLDTVLVVLNNGVLGSQRQSNILLQGKDHPDLHIGRTDFCGLARAFGWNAARVSSLDEFDERYAEARLGGCWLIDVESHPDDRAPLTKFEA